MQSDIDTNNMQTTLDQIQKQEQGTLKRLVSSATKSDQDDRDDQAEDLFQSTAPPFLAKLKARQQLSVSDDSPFNYLRQKVDKFTEEELNRLREEKAKLLREETEDIKKQLELVKTRLGELRDQKRILDTKPNEAQSDNNVKPEQDPSSLQHSSERATLNEVQIENTYENIQSNNNQQQRQQQRLRPLTGKTDCPNCSCDRRRSVCDKCIEFVASSSNSTPIRILTTRRPSFSWHHAQQADNNNQQLTARIISNDERPIRPAPEYRYSHDETDGPAAEEGKFRAEVQVDHSIVPNRIYTIGKSLNDKRNKLANAIDELQTMMDKVKQREERLEKERKVAQLYKQQWRYGPAIGGSGNAALNRRQAISSRMANSYVSRLDPRLAGDTNSLMGFQHIEPTIKHLRQSKQQSMFGQKTSDQRPRAKPRFSKMSAQTVSSRAKMVNKVNIRNGHIRSRSFDSLRQISAQKQQQMVMEKTNNKVTVETLDAKVVNHNVSSPSTSELVRNKSASETDLSQRELKSPDEAVEEEIEDDVREKDNGEQEQIRAGIFGEQQTTGESEQLDGPIQRNESSTPSDKASNEHEHRENVQKMTWIPVFGETEIKTITKRTPKRKVQVVQSEQSHEANSLSRARETISRTPILRPSKLINSKTMNGSNARTGGGNQIILEARKKLQFANQLLENERQDSGTKNQILVKRTLRQPIVTRNKIRQSTASNSANTINKQQAVPLARAKSALDVSKGVARQEDTNNNVEAQSLISDASREISRLERLIGEQQDLLSQLIRQKREEESNTGKCNCSCCISESTIPKARLSCSPDIKSASHKANNLIHNLRERLNKTKARLAKTLEEEKARHQRLEQKVDLSLKKQSDLENENELLKRSLNKCIDTCLRDISNTFESLSETLDNSIVPMRSVDQACTNNSQMSQIEQNSKADTSAATTIDSSASTLTNAAQLISDNRHLKMMKSHIENIERQRRCIFEELGNEKQRSKMLELELKRSKHELDQLIESKQRLESQLANSTHEELSENINTLNRTASVPDTGQQQQQQQPNQSSSVHSAQPNGTIATEETSQAKSLSEDQSSTFNSIDIYRQYIESMSPDLDAIRRERQMILNEFDSVKKMLIEMDK